MQIKLKKVVFEIDEKFKKGSKVTITTGIDSLDIISEKTTKDYFKSEISAKKKTPIFNVEIIWEFIAKGKELERGKDALYETAEKMIILEGNLLISIMEKYIGIPPIPILLGGIKKEIKGTTKNAKKEKSK